MHIKVDVRVCKCCGEIAVLRPDGVVVWPREDEWNEDMKRLREQALALPSSGECDCKNVIGEMLLRPHMYQVYWDRDIRRVRRCTLTGDWEVVKQPPMHSWFDRMVADGIVCGVCLTGPCECVGSQQGLINRHLLRREEELQWACDLCGEKGWDVMEVTEQDLDQWPSLERLLGDKVCVDCAIGISDEIA